MSKSTIKKEHGKMARLSHGFYAVYFSKLEESALKEFGEGIEKELEALRVAARRLFERASEEGRDWESEMRLLDAFGRHCQGVASLVRTRKIISNMSGESGEAVKQALLMAGESWPAYEDRK